MANVAVKRVGPHHPGGRTAGCPHPAGPPAAANTPGGYGIRPYDRRRAPRPTGKLRPCHTTNPCRGRCSHIGPAGRAPSQGSAGGSNAPPLQTMANRVFRVKPGRSAAIRADVGRDALIPPGLPLARAPRADMESAPVRPAGVNAPPLQSRGNYGRQARPPHRRNPCRGRCHASARGACVAARPAWSGHASRPYEPMANVADRTGTPAAIRADVGRDALIPPGLPPPRTPRADMESAPTTGGGHRGQPGNYGLATPQTPVGDDACIVPGTMRRRKVPRAG